MDLVIFLLVWLYISKEVLNLDFFDIFKFWLFFMFWILLIGILVIKLFFWDFKFLMWLLLFFWYVIVIWLSFGLFC